MEVRSSAPTVGATALVANTALPAAAAARRVLTGTAPGSYGFEMRPTSPGEGAKQNDPFHVVSGLAKDANRRSNLLLLETSGYDTTVEITLKDRHGVLITKNGQVVRIQQTIPANGTIQLNGDDAFFDGPVSGPRLGHHPVDVERRGRIGRPKRSVVGMATVIDNRTQDFVAPRRRVDDGSEPELHSV